MRIFYIYILFFSLAVLIPDSGFGAKPGSSGKYTISGHIKDKDTGEDLIGATVYVEEIKTGTTSNEYGFFSITLESGSYTLRFSFLGYEDFIKKIELTGSITLNVEMKVKNQELSEVVITEKALNDNVTNIEMGSIKMNMKTIREIPAMMGEVDIIKAIILLPGVQTISEGGSGYSVRGGSMDQNLIQLDEATVYNASHLMGFFSVFNNDAIKDVKLYKGDIPAFSGGRLSSLLDIRMKDGNLKKFSGTGGIGTISSRLTLEGPIIKNKASFIVSGRRTYADLFLKLSNDPDNRKVRIYFYDFNGKVNYNIDKSNRIFISAYYGKDVFKNNLFKMGWGNSTITARWNHLFSQRLFSNFTAVYSRFNYNLGVPEGQANSFEWKSDLTDGGLKADFTYFLNSNNTIKFGASSIYHMFKPGTAKGLGEESVLNEYVVPDINALESGIYISNEQKAGRFTLKYGLRYSFFQNVGPSTIYNFDNNDKVTDSTVYSAGAFFSPYGGLEPRLGIVFLLNEKSSVKASYSRTRQYVHLAQNSTAGTPLDIWFPSSPNVKPEIADQFSLGYFRNFSQNRIETSVEAYYKKIDNALDFKDHAELLLNKYLEGELRYGEARAYGLEFLARYNFSKFSGWVSYTLSKTEKKINGINKNNWYPATYDRPNDISIVVTYDLSRRVSLGATWVYSTGSAVTFPTGKFEFGNIYVPVFSSRNGYRMPDYHRLDLSATLKRKDKPDKKWDWNLNLSIYNAYGRKNPWVINFKQEEDDPSRTYAEMIYLFGIVPALTFNFSF